MMGNAMRRTVGAAALGAMVTLAHGAGAQALTPEELSALIDQRVEGLDPYQALLNDPDPARSRAAVQIMMETRNPDLVRMAREFGLLSPNPEVQRLALEAFLATGPVLSIRFDGAGLEETYFANDARGNLDASLDPDLAAHWTARVGAFDPAQGCFVGEGRETCFVTVGFDGVRLAGKGFTARGALDGAGSLAGFATMARVAEAIPFTIPLVD